MADLKTCSGNILLEPRLQEYLKKKKFNKDNNINICIPLEQQYQITHADKMLLREYFKGNTHIYNQADQEKFNRKEIMEVEACKVQNQNATFLADELIKTDPRFERMKTKMLRNKKATEQRHNYFGDMNEHFFLEKGFKEQTVQFSPQDTKAQNVAPKIQYKTVLDYSKEIPIPNTCMPFANNNQLNTKEIMEFAAKVQPTDMYTSGCNISSVNAKSKSFGYKNPTEHYFNYISDDIQASEHCVLPWARGGVDTRHLNHKNAHSIPKI